MSDASEKIGKLVQNLSDSSRKKRQDAALSLVDFCEGNAQDVLPFGQQILAALDLPEARTRWAILDVLSALAPFDEKLCEQAIPGVENALFDEFNGPLHLASVRFLCSFGAQSPQASDIVWPLLDEAIQCFHGDQEFFDMLNLLVDFSRGNLSDQTKEKFRERMAFDATNNRGITQRRAKTIVENVSK